MDCRRTGGRSATPRSSRSCCSSSASRTSAAPRTISRATSDPHRAARGESRGAGSARRARRPTRARPRAARLRSVGEFALAQPVRLRRGTPRSGGGHRRHRPRARGGAPASPPARRLGPAPARRPPRRPAPPQPGDRPWSGFLRYLLVVALVVATLSGGAQPAAAATAYLDGFITSSSTGAPLANVCVTLGPPTLCTTATDADGYYKIDGFVPGPTFWVVYYNKEGYARLEAHNVQIDANNTRLNWALNPGTATCARPR